MRFSALIPAYNEAKTIQYVVSACKAVPDLEEIIVISDGSIDGTSSKAKEAGATKIIEVKENKGKDFALDVGIKNTQADFLLLLDADLVGLKPAHIQKLIEPIIQGRADSTIGLFKKGNPITDFAQVVTPALSGQRVIPRWVWEKGVVPYIGVGYGLEILIQRYLRLQELRVEKVNLVGLSQITKENKVGLAKGLRWRMRMYREIMKAILSLKRGSR